MTEAQTYAWIFYAVSAVAGNQPAKRSEVESAADAINHAIPTQKEMATSLKWAELKNLIMRSGKIIQLTEEGQAFISEITSKSGSSMKTWERITKSFERLGADNCLNVDCRTMKTL